MQEDTINQSVFIDPVCFKAVPKGENSLFMIYKFRTYYFCKAACRHAFEMHPEKYIEPGTFRAKEFWDRCWGKVKGLADHKIF